MADDALLLERVGAFGGVTGGLCRLNRTKDDKRAQAE
jgi:hypothetical protein